MPSFRSPRAQAAHAVQSKTTHGQPRHGHQNSGAIHSIGTERNYSQALAGVTTWLHANHQGNLKNLTPEQAHQYLYERASRVGQKTLDLDRQAMQMHLGHTLDRIASTKLPSALATESRAYTPTQVMEITSQMPANFALATNIALAAGLRACELLTLRPTEEKMASGHREWSDNRFSGQENHVRYTVTGKGGLIREVTIPRDLASQLEVRRLSESQKVSDRGIFRSKAYDIPGGKKFSEQFSATSKQVLGFSLGAHGLRHTYAQKRVSELQANGHSITEAKGITAQELGHFSMTTTEAYLR